MPADAQPATQESLNELVAFAYQELRAIAHGRLAARRGHATLSTTALVHEAYLKLANQSPDKWRDRAHFLAVASLAMRHVVIDCVKARLTLKRGGERRRITLDDDEIGIDEQAESLLQLDDALARLAAVDARLVRVVECRFFAGMSEDEIAEALGVTVRTVRRDWVKARILLRNALEA